jgi:hypothetical protein
MYPLSTPTFPLPSSGARSTTFDTSEADPEESSPSTSAQNDTRFAQVDDLEDQTITPDKGRFLPRRIPSEIESVSTNGGGGSVAPSAPTPQSHLASESQFQQHPRLLT